MTEKLKRYRSFRLGEDEEAKIQALVDQFGLDDFSSFIRLLVRNTTVSIVSQAKANAELIKALELCLKDGVRSKKAYNAAKNAIEKYTSNNER